MADEAVTAGPKPMDTAIVKWGGAFVLGGAILIVLVGFVSLTLARFDMIEKITGFIGFMTMLNPARTIAVIAGLVLAFAVIRKVGPKWQAATGLVLSLVLLAVLYSQVIIPGGKVPPIHDITTNVDNVPQFTVIDRPEVSTGPFTIEEWRAFHTGAYSDVAPIIIDKSPTEVLADARALMEDRGWAVAETAADSAQIEATAYAGYLKFRDDVIVRATPIEDGSTRVDMRSVSQVGVSDLGYNAQRIRDFLADLQAR